MQQLQQQQQQLLLLLQLWAAADAILNLAQQRGPQYLLLPRLS